VKGRIHTDSMLHEFRLLRNRIESELHGPAVLLVTSATDRDGAAVTAYGLAESLSKTHQRTALVTTAKAAVTVPQLLGPAVPTLRRRASDRLDGSSAKSPGGLSVVSISQERLATISRSNVSSLVEELRADHDYVVVDGGNLPANSFALLVATSADAVLVTFLAGRQQTPQDRTLLDTLERTESKVLGVVMTDQVAIDHFERREEGPADEHQLAPEKRISNPIVQRLEVALNRALGK
jgi:Mrp family chromosome partitioning ATPase